MNFNRYLPRRLRERFTIIALVCSGVIFFCTAPFTVWQGRELLHDRLLHDLNDRLDLQFNKVYADMHSIRDEVLSTTDLVQQWNPAGLESWYDAMENALHRIPDADAICLAFEPDSRLGPKKVRSVVVRRGGAGNGKFIRQRLTYEADDPASPGSQWYIPLRSGNMKFISGYWSPSYLSSDRGHRQEITFSVPINREQFGKPIIDGVIAVDITLESILQSMDGLDIGTKYQMFILDSHSRLLAGKQSVSGHSQPDKYLQNFIRSNPGAMTSLTTLHNDSVLSGSFIARNPYNGVDSYFLFRRISQVPLIFVYVIPASDLNSDVWWLAGGVFTLGMLCIAGIGLLFRWSAGLATRNLDALREGVRNVNEGNFQPITQSSFSHDETADVIDAFNGMVNELQLSIQHREQMARSQQRMTTELELAHNIQLSVLPPPLKLMGGGHFSLSIPAQEVGGDFFDHFVLPGGRTVFTVGDVSGKGISAAMFMMRVSLLLRSMVSGMEPVLALTRLNAMLAESNPQMMFVTLFLVVLDPLAQSITTINCGHNPPILIRGDGTVEFLSQRSGPALGVLAGKQFTSWQTPFHEGDLLAVYTDGISEAMDLSGEQFGTARMVDFLLRNKTKPLQQSAEELVDKVVKWQGGQDRFDDITLSLIETGCLPSEHRLPASNQTIEQVVELIQSTALEGGMERARAMEISLAVCEAITNVINYSLREDTSKYFRLFTSWYGDDFVVRIEDSGPPFDPDTLPAVDVTLSLEDRQIGGLGWYIIRQSTDEAKVFRSADTNILTMVRSRHRLTVGQKKTIKGGMNDK